jgi:hypothetical protein
MIAVFDRITKHIYIYIYIYIYNFLRVFNLCNSDKIVKLVNNKLQIDNELMCGIDS